MSTILCVYPEGHGRGAIAYKRSEDGGITWSDRLPVPGSWESSLEVPTIFKTSGFGDNRRLVLFSGLYPARRAISDDGGATWSELEPLGEWGGIVVMASVVRINNNENEYMAFFHDDMRYFTADGHERYAADRELNGHSLFTLYSSISKDAGSTWSKPKEIFSSREMHLCEPGVLRSPDGKQLAMLLRENSRSVNSQLMLSEDEGATWSEPLALPNSLTGDRHAGAYAPDGRLVISFRDISPSSYHGQLVSLAGERGETNLGKVASETGLGSPTEGDWVAWVGTWDDLVKGAEGQYRIRIKDNKKSWDTAYPGIEVLPDGTFVITTYGHWDRGSEPYILSSRFRLEQTDRLLRENSN